MVRIPLGSGVPYAGFPANGRLFSSRDARVGLAVAGGKLLPYEPVGYFGAVIPGQSSVLKGEAGSPSLL